jgi:cobyrinic acid a,c-diamide synthase
MSSPAAIIIGGTASGVGKTSVATGLMAALRAAGHVVQGTKVGPDYIDPSYHALATGRPARNLDVHLSGEDLILPLLLHGSAGADVVVVEGVMGLFDGRSPDSDNASTAHIARLLGAPVVLVVDAGAMARSAAAVVHGYATFDPAVEVAGVVFNQVGSPRHADILRTAVEPLGIPVLGVMPRTPDLEAPSRHLGLVPAVERVVEAQGTVDALGDWVAAHIDLADVVRLARTATIGSARPWSPRSGVGDDPGHDLAHEARIGVADGPAFSFRYTENLELLAAAGAELVPFDPIADPQLPDVDGLYLGGGFPEVHAEALAANEPVLQAVRALALSGAPVVAECGGLLYLCRALDGVPQAGVLPVDAAMGQRLTLGYRSARAATDSVLWRKGEEVSGHEFHRTATDPVAGPLPAWTIDGTGEGFVQDGVHASYLHTHWAATPQAGARLVAAAAAARGGRGAR